jgi:hypothetical protein
MRSQTTGGEARSGQSCTPQHRSSVLVTTVWQCGPRAETGCLAGDMTCDRSDTIKQRHALKEPTAPVAGESGAVKHHPSNSACDVITGKCCS